jgi:hypothetical protein
MRRAILRFCGRRSEPFELQQVENANGGELGPGVGLGASPLNQA